MYKFIFNEQTDPFFPTTDINLHNHRTIRLEETFKIIVDVGLVFFLLAF